MPIAVDKVGRRASRLATTFPDRAARPDRDAIFVSPSIAFTLVRIVAILPLGENPGIQKLFLRYRQLPRASARIALSNQPGTGRAQVAFHFEDGSFARSIAPALFAMVAACSHGSQAGCGKQCNTGHTKSTKVPENEALDANFPLGHAEVHPYPDLHPGRCHVGQQLGLVRTKPDDCRVMRGVVFSSRSLG